MKTVTITLEDSPDGVMVRSDPPVHDLLGRAESDPDSLTSAAMQARKRRVN